MKRIDDLPSEEIEPRQDDPAMDKVEEASEESFPASDPPSWTVSTGEKGSHTEQESPNADTDTRNAGNGEGRNGEEDSAAR